MTNESTLHPEEANEPLLTESTSRWCMFPVQYNSIWEYYKKAEASFWTGIVPLEYVDFKLQACGASDHRHHIVHAQKHASIPRRWVNYALCMR